MSPIAPLLVGLDAEILPDGVVVVKDVNGEDDGQEEREAADAAAAQSGEEGYEHLRALSRSSSKQGEGCTHLMKSVTASCASKYVSHMNVIIAPHTHACHAKTARDA